MTLQTEIPVADGVRERAVGVRNGAQTLRGNLILPPAASRADTGVLFIHGWGGVRSGPHNLLTAQARALGRAGYASLRFDLGGRGESVGDAPAADLAGMAEDALRAAAVLKESAGVDRLVLVGICSGGNVAIGILDRLPEAAGLFLMSVYPFGDADSFTRDARRSMHYLQEYWRKLWLRSTWRRLFHGEVDVRAVVRIALGPLWRRVRPKPTADNAADNGRQAGLPASPLHNLLLQRPRVCLVYGGRDPEYTTSYKYYEAFEHEHKLGLQITSIAEANHNFYSIAWKREIETILMNFVKEV